MELWQWWLVGVASYIAFIILFVIIGAIAAKITDNDDMASGGAAIGVLFGLFGFILGFGLSPYKKPETTSRKTEYSLVLPSQVVEGQFGLFGGYVNSKMKWEVYQEVSNGVYERKWIDNYKLVIDPNITDASKVYLEWNEWTNYTGFGEFCNDKGERLLHVAPSVITKQMTGLELK